MRDCSCNQRTRTCEAYTVEMLAYPSGRLRALSERSDSNASEASVRYTLKESCAAGIAGGGRASSGMTSLNW